MVNNLVEEIKTLKGINDNNRDELILAMIKNVSESICLYISEEEVPKELSFVVVNIVLERLSKYSDEGVKSFNIGGQSYTYEEKGNMHGYEKELNLYLSKKKKYTGLGVLRL